MLVHKYKLFKMKPYETITEIFTKFTDILNGLKSLGKDYSNSDVVHKILRSLPKNWKPKVTTIQEAKDLKKIALEELIGLLMTHELNINQGKEKEVKKKKSIVPKATAIHEEESDSEEDSEDDKEMAILARKFKKFMRRRKKFEPRRRYNKREGSKEKEKKKEKEQPLDRKSVV